MDLNTLSVILVFHFFELCLMIFDDILCIFHGNMKSERRGMSYNSFCRRNFGKRLDMNFISSKKHESIFFENEPTFLIDSGVNRWISRGCSLKPKLTITPKSGNYCSWELSPRAWTFQPLGESRFDPERRNTNYRFLRMGSKGYLGLFSPLLANLPYYWTPLAITAYGQVRQLLLASAL